MGFDSDLGRDEKYGREVRPYHKLELKWIVYGPNEMDVMSLNDRNIGTHYNPWMIFRTKEDRDACVAELEPTFKYDYNDYDDYGNDYDYDYCYYDYDD